MYYGLHNQILFVFWGRVPLSIMSIVFESYCTCLVIGDGTQLEKLSLRQYWV